MKPFPIEVDNHGFFAEHNMPCAVNNSKFAVYECQSGIFQPSWSAQNDGWRLIQAKTKFQKFLLKRFFKRSCE